MLLVDKRVHSEHVQVIRSDIEPESVEKCSEVENGMVSEKIIRVRSGTIFHTPTYFFETEDIIFKI
jgi:hypothetical protein